MKKICLRRLTATLLCSATGGNRETSFPARSPASGRERLIMTLYYNGGLTMKQIGLRLGIDESRVSQLHSAAIARLRSRVAGMLGRPARVSGKAAALTPVPAQG